jgi:hypothetical protein
MLTYVGKVNIHQDVVYVTLIGVHIGGLQTYQYDVNGNQLSSTSNANNSNRAITYTTFNKTKRLTTQTPNGFEINEISYDANHKRIIQKAYYDTNTTANNPNKTTYHINKGYAVMCCLIGCRWHHIGRCEYVHWCQFYW